MGIFTGREAIHRVLVSGSTSAKMQEYGWKSGGGKKMSGAPGKLNYTPLEYIEIGRPVDRIAYISGACKNKVVLDLGALDETAFAQKTGHGTWLHEEIARVAVRVIGLDSSNIVLADGLVTARNAVIRKGNILDIDSFLSEIDLSPDVVVAGELIEHLDNPLQFLQSFRRIPRLKGKALLLSTPNATAIHNCLIAMANRESTHPDHLCILSLKTLSTLLSRAGYESWQIIPYHAEFVEMKQRNYGIRKNLVMGGETAIRLVEKIFPLLSFGLIVATTI
jgi:SAM-dependent methyltransferase